jgi:cytochrome b561
MKDSAKALSAIAIILFACLPLSFFWCAYVTTVLWGWFAVPLGVQQIGIFHAYGLALLAAVMVRGYSRKKQPKRTPTEELEDAQHILVSTILAPALVLLFGWLAHLGM